jgi:hypothetical protein
MRLFLHRGVDKFFKILAEVFLLAKSEINEPKIQKGSVRGEKTLARLASGFVFLLANPDFYSHLVSWRVRVVVRTAVLHNKMSQCHSLQNKHQTSSISAVSLSFVSFQSNT